MPDTIYYPLAKVQQEILAFELEYPGTSLNNICFWVNPNFDYTHEEVEEAVQLIIKNSQAIRLQMHQTEDGFCQYEQEYTPQTFTWCVDKSKTCLQLVEEQQEKAAVPFELWDSPLYRVILLEGSDGITLFGCIHHLVLDGWASKQFILQFYDNCAKLRKGEAIEIPECKYTDFVAYEAEHAEGFRHEKDKAFWQELFKDYQGPALVKPGCEGYEAEVFPKGERLSRVVPAELMQKIKSFCGEKGISSPSIICKSAILFYLHKMNPERSFVDMGEMILNRRRAVDKVALGNYAAEIIVRAEFKPELTALELLQQVQSFSRTAYRHTNYLHDDILEYVQEQNEELEAIRDIEFGYFPDLGIDDTVRLDADWIFNGVPETTIECVLYDFYRDTLLLVDYQDHILNHAEAVRLQDNLMYLMEKFVSEPEAELESISLL